MDITFNSKTELYERLKPALLTKQEEMRRHGFPYIKKEDIWNYLIEIKWKNAQNLSLYDMVSDILNCDNYILDNYLKKKLNSKERNLYFNTEE
ncbi:MAG: post-transcriptional regulator [Bacilli bacterium]|nr:post-transcriptional regulator [Bacilli bacterium]